MLRFKNNDYIVNSFNVDPLYLKHDHQDKILDYRVSYISELFRCFAIPVVIKLIIIVIIVRICDASLCVQVF